MEIQQQFGVVAMRNWGPILLNPNQQGLHMYKTNMPPIITVKSVAYPNDMFEVKTFSSCRSTYTTCFLMPYSTSQFQKQTVRPILPDKNLQTSHKYLVYDALFFGNSFCFNTMAKPLHSISKKSHKPCGHTSGPVGGGHSLGCSRVHASLSGLCGGPCNTKVLFTKWFPLFQLKQLWIRSYDINPTQKLLQGAHTFFLSAVQRKIKSIKGPDSPTCHFFQYNNEQHML